ncbi:NADH:flavin oxidoreductase [Actinobacillus equuli]|nr:NADH:flavin oxidoreductase [Actinobacillus equuli]
MDSVIALKEKYAKPEFIVGYRFSPEEPGENGLTMADTFALIDALVEKPLQYLHVSLHEFDKKHVVEQILTSLVCNLFTNALTVNCH